MRSYLEKPFTKIGLVEWLKVKALRSSPSTAPCPKKKKKKTDHIDSKNINTGRVFHGHLLRFIFKGIF
jgi:hypothetical protein